MPETIRELAESLGAQYVGEVPDVGGGAFGMARLAHILQERLEPGQGRRPCRPTDASWTSRAKIPLSQETEQALAEMAEQISRSGARKVTPMQVAALLLEEAVRMTWHVMNPQG
jgi:hypothetical protein